MPPELTEGAGVKRHVAGGSPSGAGVPLLLQDTMVDAMQPGRLGPGVVDPGVGEGSVGSTLTWKFSLVAEKLSGASACTRTAQGHGSDKNRGHQEE